MANQERQKDQEMAQRLKAEGVERWTGICPICYGVIPNGLFDSAGNYLHLTAKCPGPKRKGARVFPGRRAA